MESSCYENYPLKIVILSNILSLSIYLIGIYIIYGLGLIFALFYLLYCLIMEFRLLKYGCVNCYYYGKTCGFGKGKISSLFFKKGDVSKFNERNFTGKDMIPDLMVSVFPLIAGIIILIINFSWLILFLMVLLVILSMAGNALVRGNLTCKKCKQRELGCPAEMLFNQDK